jgi:chromosome segregation ATPase
LKTLNEILEKLAQSANSFSRVQRHTEDLFKLLKDQVIQDLIELKKVKNNVNSYDNRVDEIIKIIEDIENELKSDSKNFHKYYKRVDDTVGAFASFASKGL